MQKRKVNVQFVTRVPLAVNVNENSNLSPSFFFSAFSTLAAAVIAASAGPFLQQVIQIFFFSSLFSFHQPSSMSLREFWPTDNADRGTGWWTVVVLFNRRDLAEVWKICIRIPIFPVFKAALGFSFWLSRCTLR